MSATEIFISKEIDLFGERWHVAGFRYDGYEHFAFLTQGKDVSLMPVSVLEEHAKIVS